MFELERKRLDGYQEDILSKDQAAKVLGLNSAKLDILISAKLIKCHHLGRYRLFEKKAILEFLKATEDSADQDFAFLRNGLKRLKLG